MSTRSRIGIEYADGGIVSIYCHWDGYINGPHGVGYKLHKYYQNPGDIEKLMSLGNRDALEATPTAAHAYGLVNPPNAAVRSSSRKKWEDLHEEFNYLFTGGKWLVLDRSADNNVFDELALRVVTARLST